MDLLIAFGLFLTALVLGLVLGLPTLAAMGVGLACFMAVGLRRGFSLPDILRMALRGGRKSLGVLRIFVCIGLITGLWRAGGVIAFFVHYGLTHITPALFVFLAFVLCAVLAYALGTSFGIIGTVGVVVMTIARGGGVNPALVAGAMMSASYFGDRGSPISSFLNLVTLLTRTRLMDNVKRLLRTAALPLALSAGLYLFFSLRNPLTVLDAGLLGEIAAAYTLTPWLLLPALLMIALPLLRVDVLYAMAASILASFVLTVTVQNVGLLDALGVCLGGYTPQSGALAAVFSGGGLLSMVNVGCIVLISSCYSGIFEGTRMLEQVQARMTAISGRIGRFPANVLLGLLSAAVFCSQTLAVLMSHQLLASTSGPEVGPRHMTDICNSTGLLAAMVPWCLACAVPLDMMGVGVDALPWACFLYLTPLCHWLAGRRRAPGATG